MRIFQNIEIKDAQKIVEALSRILADTYILYLKTQNFHWNIIDPRFYSLHKMLEEQYEALAQAVDDFAEKIRTLNFLAPATMSEFLNLTSLKEGSNSLSGDEMLMQLMEDHSQVARQMRPLVSYIQAFGDEGSVDLIVESLRFHEKTAWMLRSHFPHLSVE